MSERAKPSQAVTPAVQQGSVSEQCAQEAIEPAQTLTAMRLGVSRRPSLYNPADVLVVQRALGNEALLRLLNAQRSPHIPGVSDADQHGAHKPPHTPSAASGVVQRKGDPPAPSSGMSFWFRLEIKDKERLSADQLLLAFIKQHYHVTSDEDATKILAERGWQWTNGTGPKIEKKDIEAGYISIRVTDRGMSRPSPEEQSKQSEYWDHLSPKEQQQLKEEADRQYSRQTQYGPDEKLPDPKQNREMREYRLALQGKLIQQRQRIENLPPLLSEQLFGKQGPPVLEPRDYAILLRIVDKFATLTPEERAEYASRATATTISPALLEESVNRFVAERAQRRKDTEVRDQIITDLSGLKYIYEKYRRLKKLASDRLLNPLKYTLATKNEYGKLENDIEKDLSVFGIKSVHDFEILIEDYIHAYKRQTSVIAMIMLDQYQKSLIQQFREFNNSENIDILYDRIHKTRAALHYDKADTNENIIKHFEMSEVVSHVNTKLLTKDLEKERSDEQRKGDDYMRPLSDILPVLNENSSQAAKLRKNLAKAPKDQIGQIVSEYFSDRIRDVDVMRSKIDAHPNLIYQLDKLQQTSYQLQGITPGSIYDLIIEDHSSEIAKNKQVLDLLLVVVAIGAGLLSGGTGTAAVLAAGTSVGINIYLVAETSEEYEMKSAAEGSGLSSEEASPVWVIVSLVGLGLDLAALGKLASVLGRPARAFEASGKLGPFEQELAKLAELAEVDERVKQAVLKAARARSKTREAWSNVFSPYHKLSAKTLASSPGRLGYAVYLNFKSGLRNFEVFMQTQEALALIGKIENLSGPELKFWKDAYKQAVKEYKALAAHAQRLRMSDEQLETFMRLRYERADMTVGALMKEMDSAAAQVPAPRSSAPAGLPPSERVRAGVPAEPRTTGSKHSSLPHETAAKPSGSPAGPEQAGMTLRGTESGRSRHGLPEQSPASKGPEGIPPERSGISPQEPRTLTPDDQHKVLVSNKPQGDKGAEPIPQQDKSTDPLKKRSPVETHSSAKHIKDSEKAGAQKTDGQKGGGRSRRDDKVPDAQSGYNHYNVEVGPAYSLGDVIDIKEHGHVANLRVLDGKGEQIYSWREVSGQQTIQQKSLRFPKGMLSSHTETKGLTRVPLTSENMLLITGLRSPCNHCKHAMKEAHRKYGVKIIYQWRSKGESKIWNVEDL